MCSISDDVTLMKPMEPRTLSDPVRAVCVRRLTSCALFFCLVRVEAEGGMSQSDKKSCAAPHPAPMGVSVPPGKIAFTRIRFEPYSAAST